MKKNLVLCVLFLGCTINLFCRDDASRIKLDEKFCGQNPEKIIGGKGTVTPEYLLGVWVENNSKEDVKVMVDGGNIDGYLTIPAGTKKFMDSPTPYAKGLRWKVGASVYKTAKYDKPTRFVIKDGNLYDVTALDKLKDMGSWTALDKSEYFDQKAS